MQPDIWNQRHGPELSASSDDLRRSPSCPGAAGHDGPPSQAETGNRRDRPIPAAQASRTARLNGLERLDLLGLRALGPLDGRVLHPLVLLEAAVTVSLDGGVVHEDV